MGKIIYTAPLKALAAEKMRDWSQLFPDRKILQLTGDILTSQHVRKQVMEECCTADILIMTVELLDSITRNHVSEQYAWVKDVELLVADEAHGIAMKERGHAIEVSIMRFCQIAPQAKIWFLSATLPNTEEFATWLTKLNGKESQIINSSWRPTQLNWHFLQHSIWGSYHENEEDKVRLALELIEEHKNESTLVFVHSKPMGRRIEAALKQMEIECEFYNADLELENRQDLLKRFESKNGDRLPVLISTSALAWGDLSESTQVLMADNTSKSIKDLEVGEWVLSMNPETEDLTINEVTNKILYPNDFEYEIELENGEMIKAGENHQFYVRSSDGVLKLKQAKDLSMEDELITPTIFGTGQFHSGRSDVSEQAENLLFKELK